MNIPKKRVHGVITCADHTSCPKKYVGWAEWARKMKRMYILKRCPECQKYRIWVPRKRKQGALPKPMPLPVELPNSVVVGREELEVLAKKLKIDSTKYSTEQYLLARLLREEE